MKRYLVCALACLVLGVPAGAAKDKSKRKIFTVEQRLAVLNRARVWQSPDAPPLPTHGAFAPEASVPCDYAGRPSSGHSPKFTCALESGDKVKVKYGRDNGEVYGELAATRLFELLGFYADRMYPVRVECRGCPAKLGGERTGDRDVFRFDIAAIERPVEGREVELPNRRGWEWGELDIAKGSSKAERDALKLLAVMIQHTDSRSEQQRLLCLDDACTRPIAMISDLGLTFGRTSVYNRNAVSGVNLDAWSHAPVWKGEGGCVGNLPKSLTGSLENPQITEAGRAFLAERLNAISDAQLRDLFALARFDQRGGTISEWVSAFTRKRDAIAARRCNN